MHTPHSGGTASSNSSRPDESLQLLQNQAANSKVAYYRRERTLANDKLHSILRRYTHDWYGLDFVDQESTTGVDVVLTEEEDLEALLNADTVIPAQRPAIIVLCSVASRHSAAYTSELESRIDGAVAFVSKPVGPYKLAKSIRMALQKTKTIKPQFKDIMHLGVIPERDSEGPTPMNSADPEVGRVTDGLQEMDLSSHDSNPLQVVQASETMAVSQIRSHAQMAISSPDTIRRPSPPQPVDPGGFPFPNQNHAEQEEVQATVPTLKAPDEPTPTPMKRKRTMSLTQTNGAPLVNPRVLLVDDNRINLKLLQTFLKNKRKYTRIDLAEDGQQALDVFTLNSSLGDGYEIIFMDISMPVMNGFEATRAIREYEEQNSFEVGKGTMVIALTGLASGKDQAEGFDAGVDIYLTKPVSFKEVGKLLDNWEAHQKVKEESGEIPDAFQNGKVLDQHVMLKEAISAGAEAGPI